MLCPICQKSVQITDPFMPFCSERCKLIDLGNWASEKYVISEPVLLEELDEDQLRDVRRTRIQNDVESDDLE